MSKDLRLNRDSHDLDIRSLDASFVEKTEKVAQQLKIRLQFFFGEWFLNINAGVPYIEDVLLKRENLSVVNARLKETILTTPDVLEILEYNADFDRARRILFVRFRVSTIHGTVNFNESVSI